MEFLGPSLAFWTIVLTVRGISAYVSRFDELRWTHEMRKELLELYLNRMPADMIAHHFGCSPAEIIRQVAYLVLRERGLSEDLTAPNFGKRWTWADDQILRNEFQLRRPVKTIARTLGRDRLGVAFRILGLFDPPIPKRVIRAYQIDGQSGLHAESVRENQQAEALCSQCRDVVQFCKCQFEERETPELGR